MHKTLKTVLVTSYLLVLNYAFSQINVPNVRSYSQSIYTVFLNDTNPDFRSTHLSVKPINESKTDIKSIFFDEGDYSSWFTRKLFKEHFLIFEGKDFWCAVDPIIDIEIGNDLEADNETVRLWNTRGLRVQAKFFKNFGFQTTVYENQATLASFQSSYAIAHGEFLVSNSKYKQANATIPGYARTKNFGVDGFDFAYAKGYFTFQATNWLNIEAGNGNHFIGHGYRSLLLSNFTVNYPYLKSEFLFLNDQLQYNLIYASQQNQYRLPFHLTPEANFEKKLSVSHYIEYSINKHFQVGIFENNMWVTTDSLGTVPLNFFSLNPLAGNSLFLESNNYNAIGGINTSINYNNMIVYGQLLFDHHSIAGTQIGIRAFNILLSKLNLQIEYNSVGDQTYLNQNKRTNYTHSNLPLAHPYGHSFQELVSIIDYRYNRWYLINTSLYSKRHILDQSNPNETLLLPLGDTPQISNNVWYNKIELGYQFNKKYNLGINFGYINRISVIQNDQNRTDFVYFGIKN